VEEFYNIHVYVYNELRQIHTNKYANAIEIDKCDSKRKFDELVTRV